MRLGERGGGEGVLGMRSTEMRGWCSWKFCGEG